MLYSPLVVGLIPGIHWGGVHNPPPLGKDQGWDQRLREQNPDRKLNDPYLLPCGMCFVKHEGYRRRTSSKRSEAVNTRQETGKADEFCMESTAVHCNWACRQSSRFPCHWAPTSSAKITETLQCGNALTHAQLSACNSPKSPAATGE